MSEKLVKASFEPHLHSKFEITAEGVGSIEAELVEVVEKENDQIESLSVLFKGPKENVLPHATHKVKHPKMGEMELFIGPVVSEKQDGIYYEAVFTRLKESK